MARSIEEWRVRLGVAESDEEREEIRAVILDMERKALARVSRQSAVVGRVSEVELPVLPDSTDIRDRAKAVEGDVFAVYYRLMMDKESPPAVRKACADALADRARGKPEQSVVASVKVERRDVSMDQVARMIMFSLESARQRGVGLGVGGIIDVEVGAV